MASELVQTILNAEVDARSLSEFVFKPAGFKVARRLAPPIDTLQFYIDSFDATKTTTDAYIATIPNIVNNAINNTAVEGGVLADTFVTATANGVGAVARTQRDINSDKVTIKDFGADPSLPDNYLAFFNAINAFPEKASLDIFMQPGVYKISKPLFFTRPHRFWSAGGKERTSVTLDFAGAEVARITPEYGASIVIAHHSSLTVGSPSSFSLPAGQVGNYGAGAVLEGFEVKNSPASGVWINAPAKVDISSVDNAQHGILLAANLKSGATTVLAGNANHSDITSSKASRNGGDGIHIMGNDANTFNISKCIAIGNGGWAVYDGASLGGTVFGCESDSNGLGSYKSREGTASRTLWLCNYSEGGTNPTHYDVASRSLIVGATGAAPEEGQPYLGSVTDRGVNFLRGVNVAGGDQLAYDLGGTTALASRLEAGKLKLRASIGKQIFTIGSFASPALLDIGFDNGASMSIPFGDVTSNIKTGIPFFPKGLTLKKDVLISEGEAPPVSGTYGKGHVLYNSKPAVGSYMMWVCVTAGTPGIWAGVGKIESLV